MTSHHDVVDVDDDPSAPPAMGDEDEQYGGMSHDLYDAIIRFKQENVYPNFADQRADRCAHYHWRMRCEKFLLHEDDETLLYFNPQSAFADNTPKIVVRRGEARAIIARIHEMIGHLGMKRTQIAVLKKLYWRSVRADVRRFLMSCDYCNRKKEEGRKIIKAPVNVMGSLFDIDVGIRPRDGNVDPHFDRFVLSLNGVVEDVDEQVALATGRYTFRQTNEQLKHARSPRPIARGFSKRGWRTAGLMEDYGGMNREFLIEHDDGHDEIVECREHNGELQGEYGNGGGRFNDDDLVNAVTVVASSSRRQLRDYDNDAESILYEDDEENETMEEVVVEDVGEEEEERSPGGKRRQARFAMQTARGNSRRRLRPSTENAASHYHNGTGDCGLWPAIANIDRPGAIVPPLLIPIATADATPLIMLPTSDPDVIRMQKKVLERQMQLQTLQEQILLERRDAIRRPKRARRDGDDGDPISPRGTAQQTLRSNTAAATGEHEDSGVQGADHQVQVER